MLYFKLNSVSDENATVDVTVGRMRESFVSQDTDNYPQG